MPTHHAITCSLWCCFHLNLDVEGVQVCICTIALSGAYRMGNFPAGGLQLRPLVCAQQLIPNSAFRLVSSLGCTRAYPWWERLKGSKLARQRALPFPPLRSGAHGRRRSRWSRWSSWSRCWATRGRAWHTTGLRGSCHTVSKTLDTGVRFMGVAFLPELLCLGCRSPASGLQARRRFQKSAELI